MSGHGESKRRRDRDNSPRARSEKRAKDSHRHRRDDPEVSGGKEKKDKKDKKDKDRDHKDKDHKHRAIDLTEEKRPRNSDRQDDHRGDHRKRSNRSRSRDRGGQAPQKEQSAADEALLGRTPARKGEFTEQVEQKRAWREELESGKAKDEDDDASDDAPVGGIVHHEDEDDVEQALAASRARREALIAKWVNKGEGENGQSGMLETMDTPLVEGCDQSSDSDKEGDDDKKDDDAKEAETDPDKIQASKDVFHFMLQQKAEHDGDMFGEKGNEDALNAATNRAAAISQTGASADDWDDVEGYYKAKIGEVMAERYHVTEDTCGKGVFSNVVKATDKTNNGQVAIKVMRCNDMMKKAAEKEIEMLERLARHDKGNKKHVIKLLRYFNYRGHLCLVFECMWDNLRVALKKYTKDKGMSLQAVRAYTRQLMTALRHIHRCNIIHADIKPDNILISAGHNVVKICDLGSGLDVSEAEVTPYLVSRFYRAPEITLGMKYGVALDVFAMGSTLFEIFTGKIMFPGKSNNDMVRLYMEWKGKVPVKLLKSGSFYKQHFNDELDFLHIDTNKATRKKVLKTITDCSAKKSIVDMVMTRVGPEKAKSSDSADVHYCKKAKQFADIIEKATALDPEKRITANDCLQHQFLTEAGPGSNTKGKEQPKKR